MTEARKVVDKLLEDDAPDPLDAPEPNIERYAQDVAAKQEWREGQTIEQFKRGVKAYIKWAHTDEEQGVLYDPADLRKITRAKTFEEVQAILQQYETEPTFLTMVAMGYFE